MRIQNKNTSSKIYIAIAIVAALVGLFTLAAYFTHTWPFQEQRQETSSQAGTNNKSTQSDDDRSAASSNQPDTTAQSPNASSNSSSGSSSAIPVETPITNPPKNNDPYPIENEHYKIKQSSTKSFAVTLYPIANNTSSSDYNAQLKAYKQEVLEYLTGRYGSMDGISIDWTPKNAQSI